MFGLRIIDALILLACHPVAHQMPVNFRRPATSMPSECSASLDFALCTEGPHHYISLSKIGPHFDSSLPFPNWLVSLLSLISAPSRIILVRPFRCLYSAAVLLAAVYAPFYSLSDVFSLDYVYFTTSSPTIRSNRACSKDELRCQSPSWLERTKPVNCRSCLAEHFGGAAFREVLQRIP